MENESLQVDFADRHDIRAKLPRARKILERKEDELRAKTDDVESWRGFVELLETRAGSVPADQEPAAPSGTAEPTPQSPPPGERSADQPLDLVVEVVDREVRPIRAREVKAILNAEGVDIGGDAVSSALYYAANRAVPPRIRKLPERGFYAPLAYPGPPLTDYSEAARLGFPAPASPSEDAPSP
jgi:hypothetical protein